MPYVESISKSVDIRRAAFSFKSHPKLLSLLIVLCPIESPFINRILAGRSRCVRIPGACHYPVGRQSRIRYLPCGLNSHHWKLRRIQKPELHKHGSLIPIDMLVEKFSVAELYDRDGCALHSLARRSNTGKHQSISMVCVNRMIISSTKRSEPIVREIGTISVSAGMLGIKCFE